MEKYEHWGLEQQEQYEKDLEYIYSHSWRDGSESGYPEHIKRTWGTYGECTLWGVEGIMGEFKDFFYDPDGVFYDLGCGTGKLISHVALGASFSKVCGIELDSLRYDKAKKLVDSISFPFTEPELIMGNFYDQDYKDATVIYFDNVPWHDQMIKDKELVIKLFKTIRPGVLIISKVEIPHIVCHRKHIINQSTYNNNSGIASIFLAIST
tara:strand:- start:14 stop:640 length:627 start_codon:yes stop_codon:yes gene_type:complete